MKIKSKSCRIKKKEKLAKYYSLTNNYLVNNLISDNSNIYNKEKNYKTFKNHKSVLIFAVLIFLILISSEIVISLPTPATELFGSVINRRLEQYPIGTNITVYDINGTVCGYFNVTFAGYYGLMSCNGDDLDTFQDEGVREGETISFKINGENGFSLNDTTWSAGVLKRVDLIMNRPPVLNYIDNLTAIQDINFYYVFNATDLDNDTLIYTYLISPSLPSLHFNSSQGTFNITPSNSEVGEHYVRIIVSDGYLEDYQDFTFTVSNINDPPYFINNISNQITNISVPFTYKINCSDPDLNYGDHLIYSLNISNITISPLTGEINWITYHKDVGNYTVNATCEDSFGLEVSQIFNLEVKDANVPPILTPIGNKRNVANVELIINITAYDDNGDDLNYFSNQPYLTITKISSYVAVGRFKAPINTNATYTINISVTDGSLNDFEIISVEVALGPYCGDNTCNVDESCNTCPNDCGVCPEGTGGDNAGGGAGEGTGSGIESNQGEASGEGTSSVAETNSQNSQLSQMFNDQTVQQYICQENWICSNWGECKPIEQIRSINTKIKGVRIRTCRDINFCQTENKKPSLQEECDYVSPTTCFNKIKDNGEEKIDCGGPCPPCPTCFDKIQNQLEEGIDCGGPCDACTFVRYAQLFFEKPSPLKSPQRFVFPWALLIFLLVITASFLLSDFAYLYQIRRKSVPKFSEKLKKYSPIRKKMFHFLTNFDALGIITIIYIFLMGGLFTLNIWVWILSMIFTPIAVSYTIKQFEYKDYRKSLKERKLVRLHNKEIRFFVYEEQKILIEMYTKLENSFENFQLTQNDSNEKEKLELLNEIRVCIKEIAALSKNLIDYKLNEKIKGLLDTVISNSKFKKFAKSYPEAKSALESIREVSSEIIKNKFDLDQESEFISTFKDLTRDKQLMSIILNDKKLIECYNSLVDVYDLIRISHRNYYKNVETTIQKEKVLLAKYEELSKNDNKNKQIQTNKKISSILDSIKVICDSIKKKQELNTQIK